MSEVVDNEKELSSLLDREAGKRRISVVITGVLLERCIPIFQKYGYAVIDGEDLPNGYFRITAELRRT
ncbi:MAG: hypothetical protein RXS23_01960 [Metallosphaera yellowstonensis]|jgi:hypothetical protein|uniref:Uncharacterized protein n=1 Tax=Metallosphaera yellowstonensis MK1 TaxID=671065 RepID=H2C3Q9_9CREN|nr:hypothetical protein [Metallosphaera yellowstonensis]EHP70880.1 hypothetical protein MetMK1DRAFT_00013840 [Metallosphaera yellowstonensis MK1]